MNDLLTKVNIRIRRYKPVIRRGATYTKWEENKTLQITYRSRGCRNSAMGSCVMCDYGAGTNLSLQETVKILPEVLSAVDFEIDELILNSYGSFLDEYEIPHENRIEVLKQVAGTKIPYITFETHYKTITKEVMEEIQSYIGDRKIAYEIGLESVDSYVLRQCLNKDIDLQEMKDCITKIHDYNHMVIFNVLFGSPFLSRKQQFEDALQTVTWAYNQGADVIVLFPMNIKPFTALEYLYKGGFYQRIFHWDFIRLLSCLPEKILGIANIAWYGNREIIYQGYDFKALLPEACDKCRGRIMEFYDNFIANKDVVYRKEILKKIMGESLECSCRENAFETFETEKLVPDFRENACEYLRNNVLKDGKYAIPWKEH